MGCGCGWAVRCSRDNEDKPRGPGGGRRQRGSVVLSFHNDTIKRIIRDHCLLNSLHSAAARGLILMTMKAGEAARTGAKSRSGGGARNVFILIMVSKILAAAAPPLPLLVDVFWMTAGGGYLYNQYSLVHNSISFTRHQFVS